MIKRYFQILFIGFIAVIVLGDLILRINIPDIPNAQPFMYWSYVDLSARLWWFIVVFVLFCVWLFVHRVFKWMQFITWQMWLLLLPLAFAFTIIPTVQSFPQSTYHLSTDTIANTRLQTYYHYPTLSNLSCDIVVTQCDSLGILCEKRVEWQESPCLAQYTPMNIMMDGELVFVRTPNDTIQIPLE